MSMQYLMELMAINYCEYQYQAVFLTTSCCAGSTAVMFKAFSHSLITNVIIHSYSNCHEYSCIENYLPRSIACGLIPDPIVD